MKTSKTRNPATMESLTRKGFLARIGAAFALPAAALVTLQGARGAATLPPAIVRQSELQSVFDDLRAIQAKILGFRRRILAGAKIERGSLSGYFEPGGDRTHLGTEEEELGLWGDFEAYGFRICPAEDAAIQYPNCPRVEFAEIR